MHLDTPGYIFERIREKYNLRHLKWHGLRHTAISMMILKGVHPQIISKKSGHSSLQVLHNTYSSFYDVEFQQAANVMEEVLTYKTKNEQET